MEDDTANSGSTTISELLQEPDNSKKHGRPVNSIWEYYTNAENPHKLKSAKCKNCNQVVNHHKKSESVIIHLNSHCPPFKKLMNGKDIADRPDWYVGIKKNRQSTASKSTRSSSSGKQPSIKAFTLPQIDAATKAKFQ
jgi:hypothetical protein